jgi:hypothetical protein
LIVGPNHPSGDPKPSAADVSILRASAAAAHTLGIEMHDYGIVARQSAVSPRQLGLMTAQSQGCTGIRSHGHSDPMRAGWPNSDPAGLAFDRPASNGSPTLGSAKSLRRSFLL